jgi:CheY-like chemotaxis protein
MKNPRSIVLCSELASRSLANVREAAMMFGATVVEHTTDNVERLVAPPLMCVVSMRGEDAFETCARVRDNPRFAGTPIVMLGDTRGGISFTELFHAGGDDIASATSPDLFARRVRAACRPNAPRGSTMPTTDAYAVIAGQSPKWQAAVARAFSNAGVPTKFVSTAAEAIEAARYAKAVIANEDLAPRGAMSVVADARAAGTQTPWVVVAAPKRMAEIAATAGTIERVAVIDAFAPPENALFVANELASKMAGAENRASTRLLYGESVLFRVAGRDEEDDVGFTYNVSNDGLFVRTLAPLEAGTQVWLELCAPRSSRRVRLTGKVAWQRHFGPNENATVPAGFGVHITDGLASDLDLWREGCAQLERDEARVRTPRAAARPQVSVPSLLAHAVV